MPHRYLTKSRFRLALECPTKLFYTGKSDIYPDRKQEDDFLKALAEGGFQVGELAKIMFPGGIAVDAMDHAQALAETQALLARDQVTLFEAAFAFQDFFIRVDVLRKSGNQVELIEVKAKSFDSTNPITFRKQTGSIDKDMLPYLQEVAFQRHVVASAHPEWHIAGSLMLADKSKTCSVDGLNQRFKIQRDAKGRSHVQVVAGTTAQSIGSAILTQVDVDALIDEILAPVQIATGVELTLMERAAQWAHHYREDLRIAPEVGAQCAKCEFRTETRGAGQKSGLHQCWSEAHSLAEEQMDAGTVLDLWKFSRKQALIDQGKLLQKQITREDLNYREADTGLSVSQRQWMQVSHAWPGGGDFYLDRPLLQREMAGWTYPLHFIDFETARVAIPFFNGQRPYDNIAFQFSHHEVDAQHKVSHRTQYLCTEPGMRPNYDFVRALAGAVGDSGTVFMWWPHENTTLNAILAELEADPHPPADAAKLTETILDLTVLKNGTKVLRCGRRAMVDLCTLSSNVFFHPLTKASSSIKKVLPAVLSASGYLKSRYAQPIYGAVNGIPSLNFKDQIWWQQGSRGPLSPYHLLPPLFTDISAEQLEGLQSAEDMEIAEGGAATTAYARLQFDSLSASERAGIRAGLLRYCELDTLAMVMVYEAWREWLQ